MGSDELLVMALALPPVWLAATLWWSARNAVDELCESCVFSTPLARRDDGRAVDGHEAVHALAPGHHLSPGRG